MSTRERLLADVARGQHSLFTTGQAQSCGFSEAAIAQQIGCGRWNRLAEGLFIFNGVTVTWEAQLVGVCLLTGGVASHRGAAALFEVPGFARARREISVIRGRHGRLSGATVHTSGDLVNARIVRVAGIPTTAPERLAVDLGGVISYDRYLRAMQDLIARRMLSWEQVADAVREHGRQGRTGAGVARAFLLECHGREIDESSLERLVAKVLRHYDLPTPVSQFEVWIDGRFVARVDFAWPDRRVILEADSYRWHLNHEVFEADREKRNAMKAAGWNVLEVTKRMLVTHPGVFARDLRTALDR